MLFLSVKWNGPSKRDCKHDLSHISIPVCAGVVNQLSDRLQNKLLPHLRLHCETLWCIKKPNKQTNKWKKTAVSWTERSTTQSLLKGQTDLVLQITILSTGHTHAPRPSSPLLLELVAYKESVGCVQKYIKEKSCGQQGQLKVTASSSSTGLTCLLGDVYLPPSASL